MCLLYEQQRVQFLHRKETTFSSTSSEGNSPMQMRIEINEKSHMQIFHVS